MKLCPNCRNILIVKEFIDGKKLFCKKCEYTAKLDETIAIAFPQNKQKEIAVFDANESEFPTTKVVCPHCDKEVDAYWALQQTRAADEPPTRFYRCKTCGYTWREYS